MDASLALVVCIIGLLLYLVLPTAPTPRPIESKLANAGFWAYVIGLAVFLLLSGPHVATWTRGL